MQTSPEPSPFILAIGEALRDARHHAGRVSQQTAAGMLGVSRQTYNEYENGRSILRLDQVETLAAGLGTTVTALVKQAEAGSLRPLDEDELG